MPGSPLLLALLLPALASAGPHVERSAAQKNLLDDFRKLAEMRPRHCSGWEAPLAPSSQWRLLSEDCAWQGRLRLHRLAGPGPHAGSCVSAPAQWWAWARRSFDAAGAPRAWYANWPSQTISGKAGDVQKLAVILRAGDGSWVVSEWNWKPSPRAATRRWQEGRWQLLLAEASRLGQPAASAAKGTGQLQSAWEQSLGLRPGEIMADQWRWASSGHCLVSDTVGVSDGNLHLPYLTEDSRLEQRAAMQLQLARRYPGAAWIKPFSLVDAVPAGGDRGARYKAVWREQSVMRGQLWIPTGSDGPVLRLRISAGLPPQGAAQGEAAAAAVARIIDQELESLSRAWGTMHE